MGRSLKYIIEEAVAGGVSMVQLREKSIETRDFLKTAIELKKILDKFHLPLIINDRMDIALSSGAAGIHVGQNDMPVKEIRRIMGNDVIIGLSVESLKDAVYANELDIDYLGISPVFTTPTKKELTTGLGLAGVKEICSISKFPTVGIGGINMTNVRDIIMAGADGVAIVSAICSADSPQSASRMLSDEINLILEKRRDM